jgi:putative sterol carrier protein
VTDSVTEFFDDLVRQGHEQLLEKARGSLRFDLTTGKKTEHWLLSFDRGSVSVSRRNTRADCVFRADRALFGRIVRGEKNALTAVLRGESAAEGDLELLYLVQRVFSPPAKAPKRARAREGTRA